MALYGYYKAGFGLFHDTGGDVWTNDGATIRGNEQFLIDLGFKKLTAYNLKVANYQFALNSKFALQPGDTDRYRYVHATDIFYVDADYMTNATYFDEVQMITAYIY